MHHSDNVAYGFCCCCRLGILLEAEYAALQEQSEADRERYLDMLVRLRLKTVCFSHRVSGS